MTYDPNGNLIGDGTRTFEWDGANRYLWIISLNDGGILRATDITRSVDYDRYADYDYIPDIPELAKNNILEAYTGYLHDYSYKGYLSVAYGWKAGDQLLMFHEFTLANLGEKEHSKIHVYTVFEIHPSRGFGIKVTSVKKVRDIRSWKSADVPTNVENTLNFMSHPDT